MALGLLLLVASSLGQGRKINEKEVNKEII